MSVTDLCAEGDEGLRRALETRQRFSDACTRHRDRLNHFEERIGRHLDDLSAELVQLRDENHRLANELSGFETKAGSSAFEADKLHAELESAQAEIDALKSHIAGLEEQQSSGGHEITGESAFSAAASLDGLDWETQKQKMLAQLEAELDERDDHQREQKFTVEGALRMTDQVVAEKEREIRELKQLLDDQSNSIGDLAVGAAAVSGLLDQDELIREERETLKRLQEQWRAKLSKAEIDISLERAKLARERAKLEDKIQQIERDHSNDEDQQDADSKKHRRWLVRLGLADDQPS